jgi:hypothetical protein
MCVGPIEEGDVVVNLLGGEVLFVLRPAGNDFCLVGKAFMHGFMEGQQLEDPDWGEQIAAVHYNIRKLESLCSKEATINSSLEGGNTIERKSTSLLYLVLQYQRALQCVVSPSPGFHQVIVLGRVIDKRREVINIGLISLFLQSEPKFHAYCTHNGDFCRRLKRIRFSCSHSITYAGFKCSVS